MLIAVTVLNSDDEPRLEFYEGRALDESRHIDRQILETVAQRATYCGINASMWESNPARYPDESYLRPSQEAKRPRSTVDDIHWAIILQIQFDVDPEEDDFIGGDD